LKSLKDRAGLLSLANYMPHGRSSATAVDSGGLSNSGLDPRA
jgi:hypothetical protein